MGEKPSPQGYGCCTIFLNCKLNPPVSFHPKTPTFGFKPSAISTQRSAKVIKFNQLDDGWLPFGPELKADGLIATRLSSSKSESSIHKFPVYGWTLVSIAQKFHFRANRTEGLKRCWKPKTMENRNSCFAVLAFVDKNESWNFGAFKYETDGINSY
jgi:hypothetical protein